MGITLRFASVEHPQSNGQVESANKVVLNGMRKRLKDAKGLWVEELPVVLWAYNTTPQSTTGETPYKLTYGVEAMIPVELRDLTFRVATFDINYNEDNMKVDLDLLPEVREEARIRQEVRREKSEKRYNAKVVPRRMKEGDLVLRRRQRAHDDSKLTPNWEGPYRILKELGHGAYHLEELNGRRVPRAWNAQHRRYFYS